MKTGKLKLLGVFCDILSKCEKVKKSDAVPIRKYVGRCPAYTIMIYRAIVISRLVYGSLCYGTAAKSVLKRLDVVQSRALRAVCEAFRTTPITPYL